MLPIFLWIIWTVSFLSYPTERLHSKTARLYITFFTWETHQLLNQFPKKGYYTTLWKRKACRYENLNRKIYYFIIYPGKGRNLGDYAAETIFSFPHVFFVTCSWIICVSFMESNSFFVIKYSQHRWFNNQRHGLLNQRCWLLNSNRGVSLPFAGDFFPLYREILFFSGMIQFISGQ